MVSDSLAPILTRGTDRHTDRQTVTEAAVECERPEGGGGTGGGG